LEVAVSDSFLLPEQEQLLCRLVEARNRLLPHREPFSYLRNSTRAGEVAIFIHRGWPEGSSPVLLRDLDALAAGRYILRVPRGDVWDFELTGKALALCESPQSRHGNGAEPDGELSGAPASLGTGDRADETAEPSFRREGEIWTIRYGGKIKRFKDTKGMRCLWLLISNERKGFAPLDMVVAIERLSESDAGTEPKSESQADQEGLETDGSTNVGRIMTGSYAKQVRQRVLDLIEKKKEATELGDEEAQVAIQTELEVLEQQYARAHGLRGIPRMADDKTLRLRKSVSENIRRAEMRIKPEFPGLYKHLRYSIQKSPLFTYRPDESPGWHCW